MLKIDLKELGELYGYKYAGVCFKDRCATGVLEWANFKARDLGLFEKEEVEMFLSGFNEGWRNYCDDLQTLNQEIKNGK